MMRCSRCLVLFLAGWLAGWLAGCQRVAPIPANMREVTPIGGSPAVAWVAIDGRFQASFFGNHLSSRAVVRHQSDGELRLALVSDEGVRLLDLSTTSTTPGFTLHAHAVGMERIAPTLAYVIRHAWGPDTQARTWDGDIQRGTTADGTRWYGGEPPALRLVTGGDVTITVDDYQLLGDGLVAHRAQAESATRTLTLTLGVVSASSSSPTRVRSTGR